MRISDFRVLRSRKSEERNCSSCLGRQEVLLFLSEDAKNDVEVLLFLSEDAKTRIGPSFSEHSLSVGRCLMSFC